MTIPDLKLLDAGHRWASMLSMEYHEKSFENMEAGPKEMEIKNLVIFTIFLTITPDTIPML